MLFPVIVVNAPFTAYAAPPPDPLVPPLLPEVPPLPPVALIE